MCRGTWKPSFGVAAHCQALAPSAPEEAWVSGTPQRVIMEAHAAGGDHMDRLPPPQAQEATGSGPRARTARILRDHLARRPSPLRHSAAGARGPVRRDTAPARRHRLCAHTRRPRTTRYRRVRRPGQSISAHPPAPALRLASRPLRPGSPMDRPDFEPHDNASRSPEQGAAHRGTATTEDLVRRALRDAEAFLAAHPLRAAPSPAPDTVPYRTALSAAEDQAEVSAAISDFCAPYSPPRTRPSTSWRWRNAAISN